MNIKEYLARSNQDYLTESRIFIDRNKNYAGDADIFDNTKKMATICQALGINVTYRDIEWIYFIGKLVREQNQHNPENFRDGINYLRRVEMAGEE